MADINDWEEFEETNNKLENTNLNKNIESEEIIKPKEEKKPEIKKVENVKFEEKKSETIKTNLKATETVSENKNNPNVSDLLSSEKDFLDLAVLSVAKIKDAKKLNKLTLTYLKQNIDLLCPTLESTKINELIKNLTVLFNTKRKAESEKDGKKPKNKQPTLSSGKAMDSAASKGILDEYEEDDYYSDENYEQDDFM